MAEAQMLETVARKARDAYTRANDGTCNHLNGYQIHDMMVSLWAGKTSVVASPVAEDLTVMQQIP